MLVVNERKKIKMGSVKLVSITPDAEKTIGYCARVSNPQNQNNPNVVGLLKYCIKHGHWSVFEMANMVLEIKTSRAISAQIIRHRSFSFQEFSQRYAPVEGFEPIEPRRQDEKNRQNSTADLSEDDRNWFFKEEQRIKNEIMSFYKQCLERGIAKESARFILPMCSSTKIYMNGTIRSWIHYINLRCESGTQKEHMEIVLMAKDIFCEQLPIISEALGWTRTGNNE